MSATIATLIKNAQQRFSDVDKQIARYVLQNQELIPSMSIVNLADAAFVSTSSVLRFTQKLGFSGYTDFKYSVNWVGGHTSPVQLNDASTLGTALTTLIESLDSVTLKLTYQYISNSHRTFLIATGLNQQVQASDMQQQFMMRGINMAVLPSTTGSELNKQIAESVDANDLLIVFSGSGENEVVRDFLKLPLISKTPIISFTNSINNWLASNSNCAYSMTPLDDYTTLYQYQPGFFHVLINYISTGYLRYQMEIH